MFPWLNISYPGKCSSKWVLYQNIFFEDNFFVVLFHWMNEIYIFLVLLIIWPDWLPSLIDWKLESYQCICMCHWVLTTNRSFWWRECFGWSTFWIFLGQRAFFFSVSIIDFPAANPGGVVFGYLVMHILILANWWVWRVKSTLCFLRDMII